MSWLPDSATFHERVQDAFCVYRGAGLVLSPAEVELVDAWAQTGVPFNVVARGLKRGAEAKLHDAPEGETSIRSLRALKRHVESEIKKYLSLSAGQSGGELPESGFLAERHKRLMKALRQLEKLEPTLHRALARLSALEAPESLEAADRHEMLVLFTLLRQLSHSERRECLQTTRALVQKQELVSAGAKREALRFHRVAWVRRRFDLPSFW